MSETAEQGVNPAEIKADPVPFSNHEIALDLLERETGDRARALEVLALDPQTTERLGDRIGTRRQELQAEADARARAEWDASPDGRRFAAERIAEDRESRRNLVESARELLVQEGRGVSEADLSSLSDEEILDLSGIEPSEETLRRREEERLLSDPAALAAHEREQAKWSLHERWWHLSEANRREEADRIGVSYDQIKARKDTELRSS